MGLVLTDCKSGDASAKRRVLRRFHLKLVILVRFKVRLQILLNHFFRHLPYRRAEIAACPTMPAPLALLQMREFLKQRACRPSLHPPHDFRGRHRQRTAHPYLHRVFAYRTFDYPDLICLTRLPYPFTQPLRHLSHEYFVPISRHPYNMLLNLNDRVTSVSIIHPAPPCSILSQLKLTR